MAEYDICSLFDKVLNYSIYATCHCRVVCGIMLYRAALYLGSNASDTWVGHSSTESSFCRGMCKPSSASAIFREEEYYKHMSYKRNIYLGVTVDNFLDRHSWTLGPR